jgi:hypothetical protein
MIDVLTFLQQHFNALQPGEAIEILAVHPTIKKRVIPKLFTTHSAAADFATRGNKAGFHVFYGVNPRSQAGYDRGERGKASLSRITHVWVDIDCGRDTELLNIASRLLAALVGRPETIIHSGGGLQALWRLTDWLDYQDGVEPAEATMRRLAHHLTGDPQCAEVARHLRLPDTINWKPDYPPETRAYLYAATNDHHTLARLDATLPADPAPPPAPGTIPPPPRDGDAEQLLSALSWIDPWDLSYDQWLRVLMAVHAFEPCYLDHAVRWADGKKGEVEAKWKGFRRDGSNPSTVFYFARLQGWRPDSDPKPEIPEFPEAGPANPDAEPPKRPKKAPPHIAVTRVRAFLAEVDTPPAWVIDDLLHAGGVSLLVAKQKVGKSTFAANLAIAVAAGVPVLGRNANQGAVQVYSLEVGRHWVREQLRQLINAHGPHNTDDLPLDVHTSTTLIPDAWEQIAAIVSRDKPALVVIDTLAKAIPIVDGNNYHEVYKALMPVMALAEDSGAHILCVHHTNKSGVEGADAVMGSVAFAASVDLTMMLRHDKEAGFRTLDIEARFLAEQPTLAFDFDRDRRLTLLGDRDRVLRHTAEHRLMKAAADSPGATVIDLMQATGLPKEIAGPALFQLVATYRLKAEGSPKRYTPVSYSPPPFEPPPHTEAL